MYVNQSSRSTANKSTIARIHGLRAQHGVFFQDEVLDYFRNNPTGEEVTLAVANRFGQTRIQQSASQLRKSVPGIKVEIGLIVPIIADELFPGRIETARYSDGRPKRRKAPKGNAVSGYTMHRLVS